MIKSIKEDTNRWRDKPYYCIQRTNIVKMTILHKAIYRFNAIPIKLPIAFFTELEPNFIIYVETQKTLNSQSYLERPKKKKKKKRRVIGIRLPGFRLHYKASAIKTVWH